MDRGVGSIVGQLYNTLIRALETERKWREADDLEERVRRLEEVREQRRELTHRAGGRHP
jgi:hypothetical protein